MGYHVISVADLEATPDRPSTQYAIGAAAGLEQFALNRYEAAPGEMIPLAYHYHTEQEEALYVLSGTLYVETPESTLEVGPDEVFVAEPESPHRAFNPEDAADEVHVLAIGAPAVDDAEVYEP
ncbi:MAG: cupin domain-containing protein [Halanaeroarchaeum sp.]